MVLFIELERIQNLKDPRRLYEDVLVHHLFSVCRYCFRQNEQVRVFENTQGAFREMGIRTHSAETALNPTLQSTLMHF